MTTDFFKSRKNYMANFIKTIRQMNMLAKTAQFFGTALVLASFLLPYDLSHLHTGLEQGTDCHYCQLEQNPGSNTSVFAVTHSAIFAQPELVAASSAAKFDRPANQNRQRAPPLNIS